MIKPFWEYKQNKNSDLDKERKKIVALVLLVLQMNVWTGKTLFLKR